jgi:hypothetical protein
LAEITRIIVLFRTKVHGGRTVHHWIYGIHGFNLLFLLKNLHVTGVQSKQSRVFQHCGLVKGPAIFPLVIAL